MSWAYGNNLCYRLLLRKSYRWHILSKFPARNLTATDNIEPQPSPVAGRRSLIRNLLKIGLGVGFLAYLVYKIDPAALVEAARSADVSFLLAALALVPLNIAIETSVWKTVLDQLNVNHRFNFLFRAVMAGFTLGAVTPGRVGEFAGRSYYLNRDERWRGAFALALSRQPELSILGVAGCAGLLYLLLTVSNMPAPMNAVLGLGVVATVFVSAISIKPKLIEPLTLKFGKYLSFFPAGDLAEYLGQIRLGHTYGYSVIRYVVYSVQFVLLILAFGIDVAALTLIATTAAIFLIRFLIPPITFMDLGIREGATVFFFSLLGAEESAAFNAAFLLFVINIALPAVAGIWYVRHLVPDTE